MSCRHIISRFSKISVDRLSRICVNKSSLQHYSTSKCFPMRKEIFSRHVVDQMLLQNVNPSPVCALWTIISRNYAKSKDKKKSDKGKKNVAVNEAILGELINVETLKHQLQKTVDNMKEEYIRNLSLRSTTGAFEMLKVKFEGTDYTLQDLAQVVRKNPKTMVVNMATFPQAIPAVLDAIQKSGMNLNPQQDGTTLFIPVPKVTKEYRQTLSKNAKTLFIKCRDSIKDIQNKQMKSLKNMDHVSSDDVYSAQQQIVSLSNSYVTQAESLMEAKQKELLG